MTHALIILMLPVNISIEKEGKNLKNYKNKKEKKRDSILIFSKTKGMQMRKGRKRANLLVLTTNNRFFVFSSSL